MTQTVEKAGEFPISQATPGTEALNAKYQVKDLRIMRYALPGILGHAETEELGARLIHLCQNEGKFVAPSYRALMENIYGDYEREYEKNKAARNLAESTREDILAVVEWEEPSEKIEEESIHSVLTCFARFEPTRINVELGTMINDGYINLVAEDGVEFLEPTEKLIEAITATVEERREAYLARNAS